MQKLLVISVSSHNQFIIVCYKSYQHTTQSDNLMILLNLFSTDAEKLGEMSVQQNTKYIKTGKQVKIQWTRRKWPAPTCTVKLFFSYYNQICSWAQTLWMWFIIVINFIKLEKGILKLASLFSGWESTTKTTKLFSNLHIFFFTNLKDKQRR